VLPRRVRPAKHTANVASSGLCLSKPVKAVRTKSSTLLAPKIPVISPLRAGLPQTTNLSRVNWSNRLDRAAGLVPRPALPGCCGLPWPHGGVESSKPDVSSSADPADDDPRTAGAAPGRARPVAPNRAGFGSGCRSARCDARGVASGQVLREPIREREARPCHPCGRRGSSPAPPARGPGASDGTACGPGAGRAEPRRKPRVRTPGDHPRIPVRHANLSRQRFRRGRRRVRPRPVPVFVLGLAPPGHTYKGLAGSVMWHSRPRLWVDVTGAPSRRRVGL
jgi:hypothetical protein